MNNWVDSITLISYIRSKDSDGFPVEKEQKKEHIPANFKGVTRQEEEHSKIMGYTAQLVVEIMRCNYSGQSVLIDEVTNKKYNINRIYSPTSETIELTCSDVSRKE